MTRPNDDLKGERLYAVRAELLFAIPKGEDPSSIFDGANMILIPMQRCERSDKSILIDYKFDGDPIRMEPMDSYSHSYGFEITTRDESKMPVVYMHTRMAPRSAEELDAEYNPDGDGEHPVYTREQWRTAVDTENTISGYWQWLADVLEQEDA